MKEIINLLIKENYNNLGGWINNYPEDTAYITNALSGKIPLASDTVYDVMGIIGEDMDTINMLERNTSKKSYYKGKVNVLENMLYQFEHLFPIDKSKFASMSIVREQVADYEALYGWNLNDKFLFPEANLGNYVVVVIQSLMNCIIHKVKFPNDKKRYKYIIENQIYITNNKSINNFSIASTLDIADEFKKNIFTGDFLHAKFDRCVEKWAVHNFTAIFCHPPYNEFPVITRTKKYIYHKYALKCITMCNRLVMLTPARWFQTNTPELKHLKHFRERMRTSHHMRLLDYIPEKNDIDGKGGLSYFIYDNQYNGECYYKSNDQLVDLNDIDVILTDSSLLKLIKKVSNLESINNRYLGTSWANIKTNDNRLLGNKLSNRDIKVHISNRSKHPERNTHTYLWIPNNYLRYRIPNALDSWKVITPETATSTGKGFSSTFKIIKPNELYTQSFCGFIVNNKAEAQSLVSYLRTNFAEKMVSLRKIKNHITKDILQWLPSVPLDRQWDDDKLSKFFKLTKKEKNLING